MSDFIKGVQVGNEVKQYDYDSLGNKPDLVQVDATLTQGGKAADAKVVGQKLKEADEHVDSEVSKVNNNSANALKGYACGTSVSVDDVSPIEHTPSVMISGKNLFDISRLASNSRLTNNGDGSLTVKHASNSVVSLKELAPSLRPGKTYVLSAETTGADKYIFIIQPGENILFNKPFVLTKEALNSPFNFYASYSVTNDVEATDTISNIQIEEGAVATEYTPYVDPSNATLTYNGQTYTPNSDGSVDGLVSISPTMEMSASSGFYVHLEYNQDTNAVIKKLTDAIVALGGTV